MKQIILEIEETKGQGEIVGKGRFLVRESDEDNVFIIETADAEQEDHLLVLESIMELIGAWTTTLEGKPVDEFGFKVLDNPGDSHWTGEINTFTFILDAEFLKRGQAHFTLHPDEWEIALAPF